MLHWTSEANMQLIHAVDIDPERYVAEKYEKQISPPQRCPIVAASKRCVLWDIMFEI